jgi:beta-glucosidase|eukprot:4222287-Prymnesium_polylepis.1
MCSYNAINGEPACTDEATLGGVLRRSLGFDGVIATDCGALADAHLHHRRYATEVETVTAQYVL